MEEVVWELKGKEQGILCKVAIIITCTIVVVVVIGKSSGWKDVGGVVVPISLCFGAHAREGLRIHRPAVGAIYVSED